MKIVGSATLKNKIDLKRKLGNDIDYLVSTEDAHRLRQMYHDNQTQFLVEKQYKFAVKIDGLILEYDHRPTTQTLLKLLQNNIINDTDLAYTLKMSHRYLKNSPHFLKTMHDIKILCDHGAVIPDVLKDWLKERERETYNYEHPNLNQSKDGFFNGSVLYKYDHDSIHRAIALHDQPAYEYYKSDDKEVYCSKRKFFELPVQLQLAGVYEEAAVLALERSLIPFDFKPHPTWAFKKALEKVCTSITSGWFRNFSWEHYHEVMDIHYEDTDWFVKRFQDGIKEGIVKNVS